MQSKANERYNRRRLLELRSIGKVKSLLTPEPSRAKKETSFHS